MEICGALALDRLHDHAQQIAAEGQESECCHAYLENFLHFARFLLDPDGTAIVVADFFSARCPCASGFSAWLGGGRKERTEHIQDYTLTHFPMLLMCDNVRVKCEFMCRVYSIREELWVVIYMLFSTT